MKIILKRDETKFKTDYNEPFLDKGMLVEKRRETKEIFYGSEGNLEDRWREYRKETKEIQKKIRKEVEYHSGTLQQENHERKGSFIATKFIFYWFD